jgi:hypothetical protein
VSKHLTKGRQIKAAILGLAAPAIALGFMALGGMPAYAQSNGQGNADLEVFGGGLAKQHAQGAGNSGSGQGSGGTPGGGTFTIHKDALEHVSWYKSRRQVSIENESPIVTVRGGGQGNGALTAPSGLMPATFGGNSGSYGAMGAPRNLQPAHLGPMTRPALAQARPLMHGSRGGSQGKPMVSNPPVAAAPNNGRTQPPAAPASYKNYGGAPPASSEADFNAARIREVKARLLGPN